MTSTDFRAGVQSDNLIEITVMGRTSGRPITLPIWFALDSNTL